MAQNEGVIQHIIKVLDTAGQRGDFLTAEEILSKLAKKFPNRSEEGMLITIRCQLHRLPSKGYPIIKRRDDETRKMGYAIGS